MKGMQNLMRQANQLQAKIKKMQEELAVKEYQASSGGEAVKVTVRGTDSLVSLRISDEVIKSGDIEMLQDLIVTAANEALRQARDEHAKEMEKLTGGMNLPGLF